MTEQRLYLNYQNQHTGCWRPKSNNTISVAHRSAMETYPTEILWHSLCLLGCTFNLHQPIAHYFDFSSSLLVCFALGSNSLACSLHRQPRVIAANQFWLDTFASSELSTTTDIDRTFLAATTRSCT